MSARAARGGPVRARAKIKSAPRGRTVTRKKQAAMIDTLPFPAEAVRWVVGWLFVFMAIVFGFGIIMALDVPQKIGTSVGEAVGEAGFAVKRVEIKGLNRMERLPVYAVALDQESMAMPLVDLEGTRQRMLRFGWVEEARVSRRLPDTLVVDIVERRPAAVWQHNQRLSLIDRFGVVLEEVKLDAMPNLPLVIGPGANRQATQLGELLGAAPQLKPMLEGASWVGGRRWDLRFQSGEVLALPEGEEAAKKALITFGRMDKTVQLLGRGLVRFDMRIPGKFIVRVSNEPGTSVEALAPQPVPAQTGPIDPTKTI